MEEEEQPPEAYGRRGAAVPWGEVAGGGGIPPGDCQRPEQREDDHLVPQLHAEAEPDEAEDESDARHVPVIRGSDLVGVINKQGIIAALRDNGNGYVQSAMGKVKDVCHRGESLGVAFRKITAQGATLIPVVDNDRLIGIVTLQNVMHSMGLIAESRRLRRYNEPPSA